MHQQYQLLVSEEDETGTKATGTGIEVTREVVDVDSWLYLAYYQMAPVGKRGA